MLDAKTFFIALIIGFFGGALFGRNYTIQLRREPSDHQWRYVQTEIDAARLMEKPHVKFYFNPYRTTLDILDLKGIKYTFHPRDEECIEMLANAQHGSSEYYAILSRNDCNRRYDFHWRVDLVYE